MYEKILEQIKREELNFNEILKKEIKEIPKDISSVSLKAIKYITAINKATDYYNIHNQHFDQHRTKIDIQEMQKIINEKMQEKLDAPKIKKLF